MSKTHFVLNKQGIRQRRNEIEEVARKIEISNMADMFRDYSYTKHKDTTKKIFPAWIVFINVTQTMK